MNYLGDGYSELARRVLSTARSNGLTAGNPVFVEIKLEAPLGDTKTNLDVFVTADNSVPAFYKKGLLWLVELEGSPFNGIFRSCSTEPPTAAVWYPLSSMNQITEPSLRTAGADFIQQQIISNSGTGGGGGSSGNVSAIGAVSGSIPMYNPLTLVYEPTNSPSDLILEAER